MGAPAGFADRPVELDGLIELRIDLKQQLVAVHATDLSEEEARGLAVEHRSHDGIAQRTFGVAF
jgi:hypothetical protein